MIINSFLKCNNSLSKFGLPGILIFFMLIGSCTKEAKSTCYICRTTWIVTTDQPVPNYPVTTTTSYDPMCDITEEEIVSFENTNKGSDVQIIGGVRYTSNFSTKCELQMK